MTAQANTKIQEDKCPSDFHKLETNITRLKDRLTELKQSMYNTKDLIRTSIPDKVESKPETFVRPECKNRIDSLDSQVNDMHSLLGDISSMNESIYDLFD